MGKRVVFREETASSMELAWDEAKRGAPEGTLALAESQTAGRGRRGRSWVSPSGSNLTFSLLLRPMPKALPRLTRLAAVAVARAIEECTPLRPAFKWPNDVLLGGKKVCGILVESRVEGEDVWAVVGVGLNVNFDPRAYPEIADIATSLASELGRPLPRAPLLAAFLEQFEALYLVADSPQAFQEWRTRLSTLGRQVRMNGDGEALLGMAEDVDSEGALLLRCADGTLKRFLAGEVSLR